MGDETPDPGSTEIVHEPTLPELELPDYHGRKPSGMKTSITGAGNRLTRAHEIGERVILVVEAKVKKAGHEELDDGLEYVEGLKVVDLFEIQGAPGKRLLSSVRQAYRTADDQVKGRPALADGDVDLGSAGVTDASGTVLTPAELAELRGDPVRAMLSDATTPVVVVYSDGARELWPDEFEKDAPRPKAGDRFEVEGETGPAAYVYVEELLHGDTGETLDRWTKEQEDARLRALEASAELAEKLEEKADDELEPPKGTAAYYRHEHFDGSVDENDSRAAVAGVDRRVVAVFEDGSENPLYVDESAGTDDLEPLDPGSPPLPGEGLEDGLEPLEKAEGDDDVRFREDDDGFAEPLPPEPTKKDFETVDVKVEELAAKVKKIGDVARLKRLREAERRGRGRGLQVRKGAVDVILARIEELEAKARDDA